ncbi:hypothetical protein OUZ56_023747 [Daphnia magna]|uniref:Uncharacterized protein n=1 Tax=Daphnia magna TaxID=35525 RepID=A0ABR0AZE0_9CRUS|nr:hypothetical protein OUZ56_023747 [Daphnia magna]
MKARSDILRMSDGAVESGQNQKNYINRMSKSDIRLSGGYQKHVLNIRPRHLSDIRRTALCYVGTLLKTKCVQYFFTWEVISKDIAGMILLVLAALDVTGSSNSKQMLDSYNNTNRRTLDWKCWYDPFGSNLS